MIFPFAELSIELALEIIKLATIPDEFDSISSNRPFYYSTACALASVSFTVRQATMPQFLRTVILSTPANVVSFIEALHLQEHFKNHKSRLRLNYSQLIRHFWSSECFEPLVNDSPAKYNIGYDKIFSIMRTVDCLGITPFSLYLLQKNLPSGLSGAAAAQACQRVVIAGPYWRWAPLTSNYAGMTFLSRITHLALWLFESGGEPLPKYITNVPFALMPNLTHFACPVTPEGRIHNGTQLYMIVYRTPHNMNSTDIPILTRWISGPDPLAHGVMVPVSIAISTNGYPQKFGLENAFATGENERIWKLAEKTA